MGNGTGIEWTDRSDWNPLRGCTRVSEGCRNCYAEAIAARFSAHGQPFHGFAEKTENGPRWTGKVALIKGRLTLPLKWRKPARVFVNSAFDLFHESVSDWWIDRVFAVMALAPQHQFQVLTKRAKRMREYMTSKGVEGRIARALIDHHLSLACKDRAVHDAWPVRSIGDIDHPDDVGLKEWPLPGVWLGVSVEDQARADERIPELLATPAAVRFLSCEPLLGAVDLTPYLHDSACEHSVIGADYEGIICTCGERDNARIDWTIAGGESGKDARPLHPDWARSLRDQCKAADVQFFFKQWGEWMPVTYFDGFNDDFDFRFDDGSNRILGEVARNSACTTVGGQDYNRIGKARAGRLLDGRAHDDMPKGRS